MAETSSKAVEREHFECDCHDHMLIGNVLLLGQRRLRRGPGHSAVAWADRDNPAEPTESHARPTQAATGPWSEHQVRQTALANLAALTANEATGQTPKRALWRARTIGAAIHTTGWAKSDADLVRTTSFGGPPIRFTEVEPWEMNRAGDSASVGIIGPLPHLSDGWD